MKPKLKVIVENESNIVTEDLKQKGTFYTKDEIFGQPELWSALWKSSQKELSNIEEFLKSAFSQKDIYVVLTGAGTSAFIGDVLEGPFQKATNVITRAVATTDIVTHPELYFFENKPVLLVSFARSGSSPESAAAVKLAGKFSKQVYHLIITCNAGSILIDAVKDTNHFVYLMPEGANDKGLAMTGSFTSMLLGGLIAANAGNPEELESQIELLVNYGNKILEDYAGQLEEVAKLDFDRAVFLGSGLTRGIARESHLKLQELTDGKVICKYDSFLGFRHGPKAVVNANTLIVYIFSNDAYVNLYEKDLVGAVNGRDCIYSIGIMEREIEGLKLDKEIILSKDSSNIKEEFLAVAAVLPAQLIGLYKSLDLGLKPDSPSESGMIHRVVQGVNIYPYTKNGKV